MADAPSTVEPSTPVAPAVAPEGGTLGGTQAPEGYVPRADLELEQARARGLQSERDRLLAAAAAVTPAAPAKPEPTATTTPSGFDPDEFRRSLLNDVVQTTRLAASVDSLKTQFPHADPSIYERVAEFGSADALRVAIEDSHRRVAAVLDTERTAIEAKLREEFGDAHKPGAPAGGPQGTAAGDPTPAQLAKLSIPELNELEKKSPGVVERVLRSA